MKDNASNGFERESYPSAMAGGFFSFDGPVAKFSSIFIRFLIVLSVVLFSISTIPELPRHVRVFLDVAELMIVTVFTIEYLIRIAVSRKRLRFVFSFYGLIDLLAVLPFYFSMGLGFQAVRIFRLFSLFRILKLARYSTAISRYLVAFRSIKEELVLFCIMSSVLLYLSAVGIYFFESQAQPDQFKSVFHCLWWALTTLTTVGYGDMFPITLGGKVFSFFVLIVGLGTVAVPSGLMASALSGARRE